MEAKEEVKQVVVVDEPKKPKGLSVNNDGLMTLGSLEDQFAFAQRLITEGMISSTFKTPQQVVLGLQYAKSIKLEPMIALKMMYVVKGRPCLYGEGPLALCQKDGAVASIREFFINEKFEEICMANKNLRDPVFGAVTMIARKGDPAVQEDYFTLDDMERGQLNFDKYGKKDVWIKFERNMLRYKARSLALKTKFADLIAGIAIAEHDYHTLVEDGVAVTAGKTAEDINKIYGEETKSQGQEGVA